jgi:cytochrome b6-f complex iron-sulfur subunit
MKRPPGSGPAEGRPQAARRRFLNGFLGTALGGLGIAVFYPLIRYLSPPEIPEAPTNQVLAGKTPELDQTPWKIFRFGSEPGILIEPTPGDVRAFSAVCTHLGCTVRYQEDRKLIWCPCHNGWYDLKGRNIAGPPPRPLARYGVNVVHQDIFVTRSQT